MSQDPRIQDLLNDVVDSEDRKVLESLLAHPSESLTEARLSPEDKAVADAVARRMEVFWKTTVVVGYLDLRRQIKASQRETADLRKQIDRMAKDTSQIPDLKNEIKDVRRGIEAMLVIPRGFDFRSIRQRQKDRFDEQQEVFGLVRRIAKKVQAE